MIDLNTEEDLIRSIPTNFLPTNPGEQTVWNPPINSLEYFIDKEFLEGLNVFPTNICYFFESAKENFWRLNWINENSEKLYGIVLKNKFKWFGISIYQIYEIKEEGNVIRSNHRWNCSFSKILTRSQLIRKINLNIQFKENLINRAIDYFYESLFEFIRELVKIVISYISIPIVLICLVWLGVNVTNFLEYSARFFIQ